MQKCLVSCSFCRLQLDIWNMLGTSPTFWVYTNFVSKRLEKEPTGRKGGWSSVTTYRDFGVIGPLVSGMKKNVVVINSSGWWFQISFIFTPIWGRFPFWPIFFRWVETTNQSYINSQFFIAIHLLKPKGWYLGGGNSNVFLFLPRSLGFHDPIWRAYFFKSVGSTTN